MDDKAGPWTPRLEPSAGPLYRAIVDAMTNDIASGRLAADRQLPTQRQLAEQLGINFTTVTRAYNEARERGLIETRVGRGSFVRGPSRSRVAPAHEVRDVNMTMNLPPEPILADLQAQMRAGVDTLKPNLTELLRYQEFGGSRFDREAGARWLSRRWEGIAPDQLLICPGAQSALLSILTLLNSARAGATLCCAELTYPGLRALAAQFGVRLIGLPMDNEGIDAEAFDLACARYAPQALYCNPTLHNPTTLTMSESRRAAIAEVSRRYQIPIIEDDAYGMLATHSPAPLATHAPELTYYIGGLSKCMGAGLRLAYVVAPEGDKVRRLAGVMRATTVMASPLNAALATEWIQTGVADRLLASIQQETAARHELATKLLPPHHFKATFESFHLWLTLGSEWSRAAFVHRLGSLGISVVPSDAFAVSISAPEAVRVCLGGRIGRQDLSRALKIIGQTLQSLPDQHVGVI